SLRIAGDRPECEHGRVVRPSADLDLDAGDALPAAGVQRSLRHERVLERERRACEALVDDQAAVRSELELAPGADAFRLEERALSFGERLVDPSLQDEGGPIERHRGLLMVRAYGVLPPSSVSAPAVATGSPTREDGGNGA